MASKKLNYVETRAEKQRKNIHNFKLTAKILRILI